MKIFTGAALAYEDVLKTMSHPDLNIKGMVLKMSNGRFRVIRVLGASRYASMCITSDYLKAKQELELIVYGTTSEWA